MSYTEIMGVNKDGELYHIANVRNAWRGAMTVWSELAMVYLDMSPADFMLSEIKLEALWDLVNSKRVPKFARIVHASTFDKALVAKKNIGLLEDAFNDFDSEFNGGSLLEQMKHIKEEIENNDCIAIGWTATSVAADLWDSGRWTACALCSRDVPDYDNCDACDDRETLPYNINIDNDHFFVFEKYPELLS